MNPIVTDTAPARKASAQTQSWQEVLSDLVTEPAEVLREVGLDCWPQPLQGGSE